MRFFKIANFPQQRLNNKQLVSVKLPSWLPPGPAVLRWDWYATHNAPWTEFYANCVDIEIDSTSNVVPEDIPSYKIEVGGSSATSYSAYDCEDCWCFDCSASEWKAKGMNGPACVGGVEGNCCDLDQYSPVGFESNSGAGFTSCSNKGNSGAAPWADNDGGGSGDANDDGENGDDGADADDEEEGGGGELPMPVLIGGAFVGGAVVALFGVLCYMKRGGGGSRKPKQHGGGKMQMTKGGKGRGMV
jgi:hypothetical protein